MDTCDWRAAAEQPDVGASTAEYARRFRGSVGRWFLEVQAASTLGLLRPLGPALEVVDVGGGHAQLVGPLLEGGHRVVVVGSTAACSARLAPWRDDERCRFEVGNLLALPFADGSFDVALSFRTLSHLHDWPRLIGELCRVAKRSVLIDYPSSRSLNVLSEHLFSLKLQIEGNTRTFRIFDPAEVDAEFVRHGYRVVGVEPQFALPMALHRAVRSATVGRALEAPLRAAGFTRRFGSPIILRADRQALAPLSREPE